MFTPKVPVRRVLTLSLAAGLIGVVALAPHSLLAVQPQQAQAGDTPLLPPVQWFGPSTHSDDAGFVIILDDQQWAELWEEHAGDDAARAAQGWVQPPAVDFSRWFVIGYFRGESTNNNGEKVVEIIDRGEYRIIRFDSVTYQTASFGEEPDRGVPSRPYGLWVLPRENLGIIVEENTQNLIGGPAVWTERQRFKGVGMGL